jgi:myo-inositol-1-phosphate synthase
MEQAMQTTPTSRRISIAIAGLGNCAASLIEGLAFYRKHPTCDHGLLFPVLGDYTVRDIDVVLAFDIARAKVGAPVRQAMYEQPNNFVRIDDIQVDCGAPVLRGPTLDGNPEHLARFVAESDQEPVDVVAALRDYRVDVLVNLLPTGSIQATEYYAQAASEAGSAFINCIPTVLAQRPEIQQRFAQRGLPLLGDDIKSQIGTTILHRALLHLLEARGALLEKSSQVNIGGNTDFANFVYRAETKLVSKRKSLARYTEGAASHVGHHYDPTRGALKHAFIDIEARVFGGSLVKLAVRLESDDKPNSAGSVVDLIRLAQAARDRRIGGIIPEACAFYMKSSPVEMDDLQAFEAIKLRWADSMT